MSAQAPDIEKYPSPNCGPRREAARPDLIVLHYTAMMDAPSALARLCDPETEVSAHYLIARDGRIWQLVDEAARAWHAGAGAWGDVTDVNSRSIGVELDNTGAHPFGEPQMQALEALLSGIMRRWSIPPERIIGHSDIAPERKADPGRRFDWRRLSRQGLSVWPEPRDPAGRSFDALTALAGYPAQASREARLAAFRCRFRPQATGPLGPDDMACLAGLADLFPVDRGGPSA